MIQVCVTIPIYGPKQFNVQFTKLLRLPVTPQPGHLLALKGLGPLDVDVETVVVHEDTPACSAVSVYCRPEQIEQPDVLARQIAAYDWYVMPRHGEHAEMVAAVSDIIAKHQEDAEDKRAVTEMLIVQNTHSGLYQAVTPAEHRCQLLLPIPAVKRVDAAEWRELYTAGMAQERRDP